MRTLPLQVNVNTKRLYSFICVDDLGEIMPDLVTIFGHWKTQIVNGVVLLTGRHSFVFRSYPIKNYRCCTGGPLSIMMNNYPCMFPICCA